MNRREAGFLLLTCHMGDVQRKVLTVAQLRLLAQSVRVSQIPNRDGELTEQELMALGYNRPSAQRVLELLAEEARLKCYLESAAHAGCVPITRVSQTYPLVLHKRLQLDSPGCLWTKGDLELLNTPMIALVGSRELNPENRAFAEEAGRQAARQGITLVSGNARGADTVAQEACLNSGGNVISVVADALCDHSIRERVLYLSEDGFDLPFSVQRALSRNRVIHALGYLTFVAQCSLRTGGTWDGTSMNLRQGWSPVFCFEDGSEAMRLLTQNGAIPIGLQQLECFSALQPNKNLFDQ